MILNMAVISFLSVFLAFTASSSDEVKCHDDNAMLQATNRRSLHTGAGAVSMCQMPAPTRPFKMSLYNGGQPASIMKENSTNYCRWLKNMISWACEKQFTEVVVDISSPDVNPALSVDTMVNCFLAGVPSWMSVAGLMEINPANPWTLYPNTLTMTQAFMFIRDINKGASAAGVAAQIKRFYGDGENNGNNSDNWCDWVSNATRVANIPKDEVVVGAAHSISANAPDFWTSAKKACPSEDLTLQNFHAYPELYWYLDMLTPQGCRGCPQYTDLSATKPGPQYTDLSATKPGECMEGLKACKDIPECSPYAVWLDSDNYHVYDQCAKSSCNQTSCCACYGCVPCKYDKQGKSPNNNIAYQKYKNQATHMVDAVMDYLNTNGSGMMDLAKANTFSMFSIETAHDWEDPTFLAAGPDGASNTDTCMSRWYSNPGSGKPICGTFDGFGSWTWDAFYEMLANYSSTTGIKNIAVYAWQFVPHSWSDGKLLPPADQTCDGAAVLCTSDENCTTWLKENNCGTDYAAYCRSDNNNCHISKAPEPTPSPSPSPSPSKPCFGEPVECKSTEECKAYVLTHNCTGVSYSYCRDGGFCQFHER